jgi:DNA-binding response OmpR family regulator
MMRKRSLVIVDDNLKLRELLKVTLSFSDYEIHEAQNADEALPLIKAVNPDTVLLDVMMPGEMDGFELCKRIKSDPSLNEIRVIMLSAKGQKTDLEEGGKSGADAYIVKPFSPLSLLETLKNPARI